MKGKKSQVQVCTLALLCRPGTCLPTQPSVTPCRSSSASCSFSSSPPPQKSPFRGHAGASHTQRWPGSWLCADHSPSEERGLWRPGHQEEGEAGSCHTRASPPTAHSWSQWQMLTHGCASGNCGTCPYLIRDCAPGGGAVSFLTWVAEEGSTNLAPQREVQRQSQQTAGLERLPERERGLEGGGNSPPKVDSCCCQREDPRVRGEAREKGLSLASGGVCAEQRKEKRWMMGICQQLRSWWP